MYNYIPLLIYVPIIFWQSWQHIIIYIYIYTYMCIYICATLWKNILQNYQTPPRTHRSISRPQAWVRKEKTLEDGLKNMYLDSCHVVYTWCHILAHVLSIPLTLLKLLKFDSQILMQYNFEINDRESILNW